MYWSLQKQNSMNGFASSVSWFVFVPPIVGGLIGYFTNDLAVKMLFRPYKPAYWWGRKLPFTPGLIPANQDRLARRVADTVVNSLLTPEELHDIAGRLLATERVRGAIFWLLQHAIAQVQLDTEQKTAKILAGILRDLLGRSLPRLLRVLARREDFLKEQIDGIFDRVLLESRLSEAQAGQLADWVLKTVCPPNTLRVALVDFLTDRNISIIDEEFRGRSTGTSWIVANLLGLRGMLLRLRSYCLDEKENANERLRNLTESLEMRRRLKNWLQDLSLQNFPVSTVRQLRKAVRESARNYIQTGGVEVLESWGQSADWESIARLILDRLRSSSVMTASLEPISQELALILERYFETELEAIVAKTIPILGIDRAVIDRVNAASPEDLEAGVEAIVKSELQAIVNLGGFLGFTIGGLQSIYLLLH